MASTQPDFTALEQQVKDVIQHLHHVMVQVAAYDTAGRSTQDVLAEEVKSLTTSLATLSTTTSSNSSSLPHIPPELVQYVENGRNPDIYTREFVELVRRGNQLMRGKQRAFGEFFEILGEQIGRGLPEVRGDVERVMRTVGGEERMDGVEVGDAGVDADRGRNMDGNGPIAPAST